MFGKRSEDVSLDETSSTLELTNHWSSFLIYLSMLELSYISRIYQDQVYGGIHNDEESQGIPRLVIADPYIQTTASLICLPAGPRVQL